MKKLLIIPALFLLAGCGTGVKKKEVAKDDVVLLKIDGNPVMTKNEFYKEMATMIGGMDPAMLPKATQKRAIEDLAKFELSVVAANKIGLSKDPEFRQAYQEQKDRLKKALLIRMYEKKIFDSISVPESDVRADYDKNKSRYIKEQGGAMVTGVTFAKEGDAKSFYEKAKGLAKDAFDSLGRKTSGRFREFGRVGKDATGYGAQMVPEGVRDSAVKLTKLPAVDFVKEGKEFWVVHVSDRKNASIFPFEEIKERVENQLKMNKFMGERNNRYEELKKEFSVEINEEFFKEATAPEEAPQGSTTPQGPGGESA